MILNPSCSEIVFKLGGEKVSIQTDSFPNSCMSEITRILKKKPNAKLEYVENSGGGGNWSFVETCYHIAKKAQQGEINPNKLEEIERKIWEEEEVLVNCCICNKQTIIKKDTTTYSCKHCGKNYCNECKKTCLTKNNQLFCNQKCYENHIINQL